jgi:hypothetical protein
MEGNDMGTTLGSIRRQERGASLLEVTVSIFVVTVTLMGGAMTMGVGVSSTNTSQEQLIAKQKAREALESVFTARNTQNIAWADIRNVGGGGIFLDGWQAMRETGTDGIANTADDSATQIEHLVMPGPDGYVGSTDDQTVTLDNYERRITINTIALPTQTTQQTQNPNQNTAPTVDPDIREIIVEVRFTDKGVQRTVRVSGLISRFS